MMFGFTEAEIARFGMTFGIGAFILYMLFVIANLAIQSKASLAISLRLSLWASKNLRLACAQHPASCTLPARNNAL